MSRIAKPAARVFAGVFLILAVLTQFNNPLIGPAAPLLANGGLGVVYGVFCLLLLLFSLGGESRAATGLYYVAGFCVLLAGLGYWLADSLGKATLFDVARVNFSTTILHAVLALTLAVTGKMNTAKYQVIRE